MWNVHDHIVCLDYDEKNLINANKANNHCVGKGVLQLSSSSI